MTGTRDATDMGEPQLRTINRPDAWQEPAVRQHPPPRRGRLSALAALIGYLLLTLALTYPLVREFTRAIPGDGFDGWQNYWNLWWVKVALLDQHTHPWFTGLLYHPTGVSLLFHTLNAFNGFTFLPVQLAWGLLPAYNSVVVFSFALGGLGAYLLARQVLGSASSRWAAFAAGVIFTFAPYHTAHLLGHMQLIALEWLPFYALYLLRTVAAATTSHSNRAVAREAGLAALFLALVALCDWYYVFYCGILTAVVLAWAMVLQLAPARAHFTSAAGASLTLTPPALAAARRGGQGVRLTLAVAGAWLALLVLFSPLLVPMVREARQFDFMVPDAEQSRTLSADLLAFVTPQEFHPLWGAWARERGQVFKSTVSEHQVFAGFSVLALALIGLFVRWRSDAHPSTARPLALLSMPRRLPAGTKGLWAAVLAAFFILSLGPVLHIGGRTALLPGGGEIPLPYGLLAGLPFIDIMRSVSRLDVMVMLALGVLAAAGVAALAGGRAGRWMPAVAVALIVFEFLPAPYPMSPPDTPAWYATLAEDDRTGSVLNLPVNWDRPGYLLYQTVHGKPLAAAYISREDPRTLIERAPVLQHFRHLGPDIISLDLAAQGQQVLADLDVRWVVLDRYKMPGGEERAYTEAATAEVFGDQPPVYEDDRITVYFVREYEVVAPGPQQPYLVLGADWGPFDDASRTRSFIGRATVLVLAAQPGRATLSVTLAPGSGPLAVGSPIELTLEAGENAVTLEAAGNAPVVVERLNMVSIPD